MIVLSLVLFSIGFAGYYWVRYMAGENIFTEFIFIQKQVRDVNEEGETVLRSEMLPPVNRIELVLPPILINNVVIIVIMTIIGIFYSHRIAGPVYRMEEDIARVISGEKGVKVRVRKKDKMKSLVQKVNQLIQMVDSAANEKK
jgi:hypothetical protein